jgi:serine/threonine protein kinase
LQPERIDPRVVNQGYDVRSDVWSLGITLTEIATGKFPYPKWNSVFEQLQQVVNGEPPQLRDDGRFSIQFINFVNTWYVPLLRSGIANIAADSHALLRICNELFTLFGVNKPFELLSVV